MSEVHSDDQATQQRPVDWFQPAIAEMLRTNKETYGPISFRDYLSRHSLPKVTDISKKTADILSINSVSQLRSVSPIAVQEDVMVFRLGSMPGSKGTVFSLVKSPNSVQDYFIMDEQVFTQSEETYIPQCSMRQLFPFQTINSFTENTLVNLAFSSGLLKEALVMDEGHTCSSSIIGYSSSFNFSFQGHSLVNESKFHHSRGQVEIDAIFLGRRKHKDCLFIIEAKTVKSNSVAKHKLAYAVLALSSSNKIPRDVPIIPEAF